MEDIYIGDIKIWAESHLFETWHEAIEWLEMINPYDIHTIQQFGGPGSMVTLIVTFAKFDPADDSKGERE